VQPRVLGPPALVAARWPSRARRPRRACGRERAHAFSSTTAARRCTTSARGAGEVERETIVLPMLLGSGWTGFVRAPADLVVEPDVLAWSPRRPPGRAKHARIAVPPTSRSTRTGLDPPSPDLDVGPRMIPTLRGRPRGRANWIQSGLERSPWTLGARGAAWGRIGDAVYVRRGRARCSTRCYSRVVAEARAEQRSASAATAPGSRGVHPHAPARCRARDSSTMRIMGSSRVR
jgi:hypothetical protein